MKLFIVRICLVVSLLSCFSGVSVADTYQDAMKAVNSGDYDSAHRIWVSLAEQGHVVAQYNLGVMYYNGQGVPQDFKLAIKWFTLAAEQGHVLAQHNLGSMNLKGQGTPQDFKKYGTAIKWYTLAAEQGFFVAAWNLNNVQDEIRQAEPWHPTKN